MLTGYGTVRSLSHKGLKGLEQERMTSRVMEGMREAEGETAVRTRPVCVQAQLSENVQWGASGMHLNFRRHRIQIFVIMYFLFLSEC